MLLGVFHRRLAIVQPVGQELRVLPRRDDLQRRIERHRGQFEADLIVALARGAVADGIRAGLVRDLHLVLRDQRTRDAGAEQIVVFVGGVRAQHREAIVFRELLAQILHHDLIGAALVRLLLDALQLAALTELRRERDELDAGYRDLSHGRMTDVSRPPEYASTIFLGDGLFDTDTSRHGMTMMTVKK